jgi:two-component system NarL family sensor kinase
MEPRQKTNLPAIAPLIRALRAIPLATRRRATLLARLQRASVEGAYLASKNAKLEHYLPLTTCSNAHLHVAGRFDARGKLALTSAPGGTQVVATLPRG